MCLLSNKAFKSVNNSFIYNFLDPSELRKAFAKFEHSGTGFVKYSNLVNLFESLGLDPPKEEVDQLVSEFAQQHEGRLIEFPEFCNILENLKEEEDIVVEVDLPEHWSSDLRDVFSVFDNESKGCIDKQDFTLASKCLKLEFNDEELLEIFEFEGHCHV